jgi:hypothetical protein
MQRLWVSGDEPFNYLNELTPRSKALPQKLTVPQLAKKYPYFVGLFVTAFKITQLPVPVLSQINPDHTSPPHFLKTFWDVTP